MAKLSKGITLNSRTGMYKAVVTVRGKRYQVGVFASLETAMAAREHVLRTRFLKRAGLKDRYAIVDKATGQVLRFE